MGTCLLAGLSVPGGAGVWRHVIPRLLTSFPTRRSSDLALTVRAAPVVSIASFSDVCVNAAAFALSGGAPAGGTYSGAGESTGPIYSHTASSYADLIANTETQNGSADYKSANVTDSPAPP